MIKKVLYGSMFTVIGSEAFVIGSKFYALFKSGAVIYVGGMPLIPYWLLVEGSIIVFAPILTKLIINAKKGGILADDTEISKMIKQYHKEIGDGDK